MKTAIVNFKVQENIYQFSENLYVYTHMNVYHKKFK